MVSNNVYVVLGAFVLIAAVLGYLSLGICGLFIGITGSAVISFVLKKAISFVKS
jgi:hypothetical protein